MRADLAALHEARARARAELGDLVAAPVIEELLEVLDAEQVRLVGAVRGVDLIRDALRGKKVAAVLSGGNVDAGVFAQAITGVTPEA